MTSGCLTRLFSGMKTIYINRPTEDLGDPVSREQGEAKFDMYIDIGQGESGGLVELASRLSL